MRLDPAPLCLRNDGGTLWHIGDEHARWDLRLRICDVCGDKYSVELLEATIKSTWEALRVGMMPIERRRHGLFELWLTFGGWLGAVDTGPVFHEQLISEEQMRQRVRVRYGRSLMFHVEH